MTHYSIPYNKTNISFELPEHLSVQLIKPISTPPASDPDRAIWEVLTHLDTGSKLREIANAKTAAIAINDKTRPVPHQHLLHPLMRYLEKLGIQESDIKLIIATGVHLPMSPEEFSMVVPSDILSRYQVICHDCDDRENLVYLGKTTRSTPIWINRHFIESDLRVVVGNIEPHQFQGFSGGVKSAAIGLAGRVTINHNHAFMLDPNATLGEYAKNPARQDIEEIGDKIGVHLALNTIMNDRKQIVHVVAGTPSDVIETGIPLVRQICQVTVDEEFDLMIVSPGGYPKDINLYQAQKGLGHASLVTRHGGTIILAAACPEGTGSQQYEKWVHQVHSNDEVLSRFQAEGFRVGPHKAYQFARDASRIQLHLISEMDSAFVRSLLLKPAYDLQATLEYALSQQSGSSRIGIMPWANATIPQLRLSSP